MKRIAVLVAVGLLVGCATTKPIKKTTKKPPSSGPTTMQITLKVQSAGADPRDPLPPLDVLIHLDIYQFEVPFGAISKNEAFWKRIDEDSIGTGPATAAVLFKNGLRCGIAPKNDWVYFRDFLDELPAQTRKQTITKTRVDAMNLDLDKPIDREDLFVFNGTNPVQGRTYESCTNSMTLSFQPTPRERDSIRMALCPVVTSHRHRMQFTAMNQEYESPFEEVSRLYDLNLRADVPARDFLIVAPSSDASRETSVGAQFLVNHDKVERLEQVIVIVPTFLHMDGKPMNLTGDPSER